MIKGRIKLMSNRKIMDIRVYRNREDMNDVISEWQRNRKKNIPFFIQIEPFYDWKEEEFTPVINMKPPPKPKINYDKVKLFATNYHPKVTNRPLAEYSNISGLRKEFSL